MGSQNRRKHVRTVVICRALLRIDQYLCLPVTISDFCSGGLLLLQQDSLQPSIDKLCQPGKILEISFQEESLPKTPLIIKCVRAEKNALGVQFIRDSHAHVAELIQFSQHNKVKVNTAMPIKNNLTEKNKEEICEKMTNIVINYLEPAFAKFFNLLLEIKQDADVMMNIAEIVTVNEVLEFLKMNAENFSVQCIDENIKFFKFSLKNLSVKKSLNEAAINDLKLSLVEKDDFEEWLSIKLITNKAEADINEELKILLIRLSYLLERDVEEKSIPFVSLALCERVRAQLLLSTVRPSKMIINKIYNLFYACVLSQLSSLIGQLNAEMSASGCLKDNEVYRYLPKKSLDSIVKNANKKKPQNYQDGNLLKKDVDFKEVVKLKEEVSSKGETGFKQEFRFKKEDNYKEDSYKENSYKEEPNIEHEFSSKQACKIEKETRIEKKTAVIKNTKHEENDLSQTKNIKYSENNHPKEVRFDNADKIQPVSNNSNKIHVSSNRPEQSITKYPLSQSLNHASFLSSKAVESVNHLLKIQQALLLPEDVRQSQKEDAEHGSPLIDVMGVLKKIQLELLSDLDYIEIGLRESIEAHLKNGRRLTTQQLLSLSLVEKLFLTLKENVEFDVNLHPLLNPIKLLVFKALLQDDSILLDSKHPVRQFINAIAFLGCRAGSNIRVINSTIKKNIQVLLREFDQDISVFSTVIPELEAQTTFLLSNYLRNLQKIQSRFDGIYKVDMARKSTLLAIDKLLIGKRVAPLLLEILETDYCEALFLAYVKQGQNSKFWKIGLLAIEELSVITATHNANWGFLKIHPKKLFMLVQAAFNSLPNKKEQKEILLKKLNDFISTQQVVAESMLIKYKPMLSTTEKFDEKQLRSNKSYERISSIKVGDALCFKFNEKPEFIANCAWIAADRSRYVFVDHLGVIIGDYTAYEVSDKFSKRQWRLSGTDDLSVFDQGLDALIEKIYTELTQSALRDELTGVLNRKGFEKELEACLRTIKSGAAEHMMIYFTLNELDILNNSAGYDASDHFLQYLTQQLMTGFSEKIVMARLGWTDFGLLLKHHDETEALRFAEDLLDIIQAIKFEWKSKVYRFGVSVGVVTLREHYMEAHQVLHDSQSAAFIAKDRGGRYIHLVKNKKEVPNLDHISSWVTKIDEVIAGNALRLRIHKIQSIQDENSVEIKKPHYEVLLSVLDGDQVLEPFEFICAAERYQRMGQVDCWVIKTLFEWLITNQDKQAAIGMLSVNLSGHSLNDGQLMKYIFEAFASSKIACEKICFEITETVALTDLDDIVDFMVELKNLGCSFALDDFGTGSSSYQYLKRLPVDFIKIDGSFVRDMTRNRQDWAMVKSITDMGHLMGISVIAEYVEDAETLNQLKVIGVDHAQGYYIEKPRWL